MNSNNIKNNNTFDKENNKNRLIYIKLSNIKEKVIVLDSKLPIHVITQIIKMNLISNRVVVEENNISQLKIERLTIYARCIIR